MSEDRARFRVTAGHEAGQVSKPVSWTSACSCWCNCVMHLGRAHSQTGDKGRKYGDGLKILLSVMSLSGLVWAGRVSEMFGQMDEDLHMGPEKNTSSITGLALLGHWITS